MPEALLLCSEERASIEIQAFLAALGSADKTGKAMLIRIYREYLASRRRECAVQCLLQNAAFVFDHLDHLSEYERFTRALLDFDSVAEHSVERSLAAHVEFAFSTSLSAINASACVDKLSETATALLVCNMAMSSSCFPASDQAALEKLASKTLKVPSADMCTHYVVYGSLTLEHGMPAGDSSNVDPHRKHQSHRFACALLLLGSAQERFGKARFQRSRGEEARTRSLAVDPDADAR